MSERDGVEPLLDDNQRKITQGFRLSYPKVILALLGGLLSFGILWITMSWNKRVMMHCTHEKCSLEKAQKILIVDSHNQTFVEKIIRPSEDTIHKSRAFFYNKKIKYLWDNENGDFVKVRGLEIQNCSPFHELSKGLTEDDANSRLSYYDKNSIKIRVEPIIKLIIREIWSPFYLYQAFIIIVWLLQLYYEFSICIALLSVISVSTTVWETRKQSRALRDAMQSEAIVTILRDGKEVKKPSEELAPGDVIILSQAQFTMTCDAVLLSGNCVVNESMLTGESTPITKVPVPNDPNTPFNIISHKRSVLSCGTEILHVRDVEGFGAKAVVYRTGFMTAKGELVRAILYPKPVKIKLDSDILKCMIIFFILGIPPVIYTLMVGIKLQAYPFDITLYVLNVITFFVPAALPAVLTSINALTQKRLRTKGIYCLNSRYINFCGGLDVVCFDKTGTLTEDSLDVHAVVPVQDCTFQPELEPLNCFPHFPLVKALATCHSLSAVNGNLLGYDMDVKLLEATGWELLQLKPGDEVCFENIPERIVFPKPTGYQTESLRVAILRQFPFESLLRRMCVITQTEGSNHFQVFMKGAPELVCSLCQATSVPDDTKEVLKYYSSQGFRVIAVAAKDLSESVTWNEVMQTPREQFETELQFLGLVVLENKLKPETVPTLNILKNANIKSIMVTGDNLLTAITVGKNCGIVAESDSVVIIDAVLSSVSKKLQVFYKPFKIPHLQNGTTTQNDKFHDIKIQMPEKRVGSYSIAMEGTTFNLIRLYDAQLLKKVAVMGTIFARMLPEQKLYLIETLPSLGYQVGMCGDGANDCGALKAAHAGISLSLAEASVAAPFTCTQQNIQCIPALIGEGRASLVSTFDSFRYMVCYGFMFLVAVLILFWDGQRPSDGSYVLIDIVLNLTPPFLFGATLAFPGLAKSPPIRSLLSFIPLFSIFSFIFIQTGVHIIAYEYCLMQAWYEPFKFDKENALSPEASHAGTTILTVNMMTHIIGSIIFASGPPYKKHFFTNKFYVCVILTEFALVTYLSLYPPEFMIIFLNFKRAPFLSYHLILYAICLGNLVLSFIWEKYIVQYVLRERVIPAISRLRRPIKQYEKLQQEMTVTGNWPPVRACETDITGNIGSNKNANVRMKSYAEDDPNHMELNVIQSNSLGVI